MQIIGHIAHFNLRDIHLPFKYLIGKITLDKTPGITTVVNKINSINNKFRNANIELIAGEPNYNVQVKEQFCIFKFNYQNVYWNSKLTDEHTRIVSLLPLSSILIDMFCGVGPFSIPSAKIKKCIVYANDANPESVYALKSNCKLNKVTNNITTFCQDASYFIQHILPFIYKNSLNFEKNCTIVMNLPAIAIDFLNFIDKAYSCFDINFIKLPIIFCYCFISTFICNNDEINKDYQLPLHTFTIEQIKIKVYQSFNFLIIKDISFYNVRKVSPNKSMFCIQINFDSFNNLKRSTFQNINCTKISKFN